MNLNCTQVCSDVARQLGLKQGDLIALLDLDGTLFVPDGFGTLVDRFACAPEVWHEADKEFNQPGSTITAQKLFQLALDLCTENLEFSLELAVNYLQEMHRTIAGVGQLANICRHQDIKLVAVTNSLKELAVPRLAWSGLSDVPVIGNWMEPEKEAAKWRWRFCSLHGEQGLDKRTVAETFVQLGYRPMLAAGDSRGDIGMSSIVMSHGGFVLAREGLGLAKWCAEKRIPSNLWREYQDFDPKTRRWVEEKIVRYCEGGGLVRSAA